MNKEQVEKAIELFQQGGVASEIAQELEISIGDLKKEIASNSNFERAVSETQRDGVHEALYQAALSGNIPAVLKWLELNGGESAKKMKMPDNPPPIFDTEEDRKMWRLLVKARSKQRHEP